MADSDSLAARLEPVLDAVPVAVIVLERDGTVGRSNPAARKLLGPDRLAELLSGDPGWPQLQRQISSGARASVVMQLSRPDGAQVDLQVDAEPVLDDSGDYLGAVCSLRDVTADLVTQSERLDEARDLFLAMSSHELRTPLTVIKGLAGTLLHRWHELTDDERRSAVSTIVHRTESLAALVDQLLLGSNTDAGSAMPTAAFDVGEALRGSVAGFEVLSDAHTIVLALPDELPPVVANRGGLDIVMAQLVENAIKFSPDGGEVRVSAAHNGAQIVVRVSDDGIGIDDDDAQLIFDRFYQADAGERRRFGGLGLGLYIVRQLVEALSGSVRAYGTPGAGATVEFTLPVASQGGGR